MLMLMLMLMLMVVLFLTHISIKCKNSILGTSMSLFPSVVVMGF